ncbi:hypothetical protein [Bradyrhizobium japonicum]|uniref:hypothetical protein n=1 Tax=Bradyrhizobium japonicum TaxID=375 RepID=UPI001B8A504F|nr:hypothetical protein [Bradyrhizobium japonicum]MBR0969620.1 hypothetical protein [Bradyrhizobium japonicum]
MWTANKIDAALLALRHQAVRRLFPQSMITKGGQPAARGDWIPSRAQWLAIDDCLDGLPERMRSSKISNAHIEARRWIVLAVTRAALELETRRFAEREHGASLENSEDAARRLAEEIADFLATAREWRVAPSFGYRASRMNYTRHNDVAKATHAVLDTIANARDAARKLAEFARAERDRLIPPHAPGDIWRQGFVATLCFGWKHLTGTDPTPDGGRFYRFVSKCYDSLKGGGGTASRVDADRLPPFDDWTGVIRTVVKDLKGRPDWDGFERYDRYLDPPGMGREVVTETLAKRQVRDTEKRNAELAALASVPGARELFEQLAAGHLDRKPRKSRSE